MSASNDFKNSVLFIPPKKRDSSILTPHFLKVLITRLCDGADLAVTSAVLIGEMFQINSD